MTALRGGAEAAETEAPGSPRPGSATRIVLGAAATVLAAGLVAARVGAPQHASAIALGAVLSAGAAALGGLAGVFFSTRPVRGLTRAVLAMPAGGRAPAGGDDEVAELGRALNRLLTEHDRSTEKLRTERDLLAGILEGMGEGVLVLDTDERIVLVNRALRAFARLDEDPRGKPLLEAIRNAALKEALDGAAGGADPVVREIELGRPLPRKLLVRVARLSQGGEELRGTIAVFHDVTDLRRLETIRTDFVANVSHELRTPVTAISTATETLLGGALDDPDEAVEFVGVIDRHSKRLRQLVDDLLDLAKLEAKSFRLVLGELDVRPIIAHAVELMGDPARRRRMTLSIAPGSEALRARVDRRALEQVLMNLLDNAIKYAGEGARVTVSARADGERVEIAVSDDGVGISPAHLGRVFERFYRVDAGRSRELGGTGLGLSIVKHLVELMGGTVDVESEPGKGARFTLRVQAAAAASPPPPSNP